MSIRSSLLPSAFVAAVCAGASGACTEVEGGAIELSWKLRAQSGDLPDSDACETAMVDEVRLWWQVDDRRSSRSWPCTDNHGATSFVVEPGLASIWITPECVSGPANAASYDAPAPILRTIRVGEVTSLDAVLISVQVAGCGAQPCICR